MDKRELACRLLITGVYICVAGVPIIFAWSRPLELVSGDVVHVLRKFIIAPLLLGWAINAVIK